MIDGDKIIAPIGLGDICRLLRERTMDLGSLCQSKTINKWAKYKPVSNYELEYEDELNTTRDGWKSDATWWKGTGGQCGLQIVTYSASQMLAENMATMFAESWKYIAPGGTAQSPFRAEDFLLYRRTAQSPFGKIKAYPSTDIKYYQGGSVMRWVITPHAPESDELSLTDISRAFGTETRTISDMWFGMVFICVKSSNTNNTSVIGKTLVKTCEAAIGSGKDGSTTLELTTADTVQFASQLANDSTYWIAYPILIEGSAVSSMTTIAGMNSNNNILFAPYKEAVVEAASPFEFLPSEYDAQARFTAVVMGTTNYFEFTLSIVNKSGEAKTVDALANVQLHMKYTMASNPSGIDWNNVTTEHPYGLDEAARSGVDLLITTQLADNTISKPTKLTSGWTIAAGASATITGRILVGASNFADYTAMQLYCTIQLYGEDKAKEFAAGQSSAWYKESDGYEESTDKTHTASLTVIKTYFVGSQMSITVRPTVKANDGTTELEWNYGYIKTTLSIERGKDKEYSFPRSGNGTWADGTWTGADETIDLPISKEMGDNQYVNWTIPNVGKIQGTGGGQPISRGSITINQ